LATYVGVVLTYGKYTLKSAALREHVSKEASVQRGCSEILASSIINDGGGGSVKE